MSKLMSTKDVADQLQVSPNTVKKLWRDGRLRGLQVSERKLRFHSCDVEEYLRNAKQPARSGLAPYRSEELAWRAAHVDEQALLEGQWLVVEGSALVAHDADPARAVASARATGVAVPYVFFVESRSDSGAQMGL